MEVTVMAAVRPTSLKRKRTLSYGPQATTSLSLNFPLTDYCPRRLVFGELLDVVGPAPIFPAHTMDIGCGEGEDMSFGAHLILLPHRQRHYREVDEPYAVVCRSDLDPILLASIFQGSDHDYLHHNIDTLQGVGELVEWSCFRGGEVTNNTPYEEEMIRHLKRSCLDEVNRVRRTDYSHSRPWASLRARLTYAKDESLANNYIHNTLFVALRRRCEVPASPDTTAFVEEGCTVIRTQPVKMESSWMSGHVVFARAELHKLPNKHDTDCYLAFNIPGMAHRSPVAINFFDCQRKVVGVVIGRGLSVTDHSMTVYTMKSSYPHSPTTSVTCSILQPPPEVCGTDDGDSDDDESGPMDGGHNKISRQN